MLYDKWKTSTDIHMDEVYFRAVCVCVLFLVWKQSSQQTFYIFNSLSHTLIEWYKMRMNSAKFTEFRATESVFVWILYVFLRARAQLFFLSRCWYFHARTFARIKWKLKVLEKMHTRHWLDIKYIVVDFCPFIARTLPWYNWIIINIELFNIVIVVSSCCLVCVCFCVFTNDDGWAIVECAL